MSDLRRDLRLYINAIAEPVTAESAGVESTPLSRPDQQRAMRPLTAVVLGAAAVLIPTLLLFGLGVLRVAPEDVSPSADQPTAPSSLSSSVVPTTVASTTTTSAPATVAVPDVVGIAASDAVANLLDLGFEPAPYNIFDTGSAPGVVVDQFPPPGETAEAGAVVRVGVAAIPHCEPDEGAEVPAGMQRIVVLYGCMGGDGVDPDISHPTYRTVPDDADQLTATIEALIAGPTTEEIENGYASFFTAESAPGLNGIESDGGRLVVDFNEAVLVNGSNTSTGMLFYHAELYANVFQFEEVQSVEFRLNGSCEAWARSFEGEDCRVLTRVEWEALAPAD